jgi:predicted regulator of Ras-like GTPase activity (Roadblock/LC7/MglB family)
MGTLPQLIEEDIHRFDQELAELLNKSGATATLLIDQGGFLITSQGGNRDFDLTTIAALASGAYLANESIANLVRESNFSCVYQQGEQCSMLIASVDVFCLLVVIFKAQISVGVVKYYAASTIRHLVCQLRHAQERAPQASLDLSWLNTADTRDIFKRRS